MNSDRPLTILRSDRPLILSVLLLAAGIGIIFEYGNGTGSFNASFPMAGASVQAAITTYGPAAMGGLALTALGVLLLAWSFLAAIVGQIQVLGPVTREREVVRIVPEHDKEWVAKS
jgi:hypothetical protein